MTASELLISAMEQFSSAEPEIVTIAWVDENFRVHFTANCGFVDLIGMAEYIKASSLRSLLQDENNSDG